ncbi:hypothetical protein FNF27_06143 [Cafeteria roenbergensis]|uniref:YHYH domain-containing protein n=1 Tax=Cafeteria roenbergensis TaxID=33653 RepID=A0A5A8E413_CAFRO|nr:hypothetical protein FNF28_07745 [Cafeteria roenbergensis]KAA0161381.1 hypothetical protein FNF31_03840 [Cafeteria roenbergensis]KAA0172108.1 hypothetical protein FNF27_06143 [Cafeteria roenbergensis]
MQTLTVFIAAAGALLAATPSAGSVPAGTALFFEQGCPDGWIREPLSAGRMIVSVTNGTRGGFTIHQALSDQEVRTHSHQSLAVTSLATKSVSGVDGSDHSAAAHGAQHGANATAASAAGLGFVQLPLCVAVTALPNATLPAGAAAFFGPDTFSCPAGFDPLADAAGRILTPAHDLQITKSDSLPLGDQEDRLHSHPTDNGRCAINTQATDFEGIGGCCNDSPSADGTYPVSVSAGPASTGLPYIQLLTCGAAGDEQSHGASQGSLPDGALFFSTSELGCPAGWEVFDELGGRFPVSTPVGGTDGSVFGGEPIARASATGTTHAHDLHGSIVTSPAGIELVHGCCAKGYAESGVYEYACATDDTQGSGLPYLMTPLCRRSPAAAATGLRGFA